MWQSVHERRSPRKPGSTAPGGQSSRRGCGPACHSRPARHTEAWQAAHASAPGRRGPVAGLPFLVFMLGFTLFRVAEYYLRPRPLTANEPVWFYPVLYAVIILGVAVVLALRVASARLRSR
jgi:hypothetical protein